MKIKEVTWQLRNDFSATMECEHCGNEQALDSGYNDANYHHNVIPAMACLSCGRDRSGNGSEANHG